METVNRCEVGIVRSRLYTALISAVSKFKLVLRFVYELGLVGNRKSAMLSGTRRIPMDKKYIVRLSDDVNQTQRGVDWQMKIDDTRNNP